MRQRSNLSLYKKVKKNTSSVKRQLTPIKSSTSKKPRFVSPNKSSSSRSTPSFKRIRISSPILYAKRIIVSPLRTKKSPFSSNENEQWVDIGDSRSCDEDYTLFSMFKKELLNVMLWDEFQMFMNQVATCSYPLDNISFLLFLDTVKFLNCKTTTQMSYRPEIKRFWKTGYRLFHAKFLYYMGGPKSISQLEDGDRGYINPNNSMINFAVPSVNTLEQCNISDSLLTKKIPAGIIEPVLQTISETVLDKRFMLCADGKKVTSGVYKVGGDVDMFGFEDGDSLLQRQERLTKEVGVLQEMVVDANERSRDTCVASVVDKLREGCTIVGQRVQDAREMKRRQEFGLKKFMALGGDKWRESKYVYAISALHTSLYQLNDFIRNALHGILQLSKCASITSKAVSRVQDDMTTTKGKQLNMVFLNPQFDSAIMDTMYIIQRTQLWKEIRKMAFVTGSTIHDAIGLRGAKAQKNHISSVTETDKQDKVFDEDTQKRLDYGTQNEPNALATLAGVVLPTFYLQCCYVEEGCYITQGTQKDALLVVSPDGSIRERVLTGNNETPYELGRVIAGVEVKCPFPKPNGLSIHYSLPQYYVCQCLAEMFVLGTERLLYMSWSEESSVVLEVKFSEDLWMQILSMICDTYDTKQPKRLADTGSRVKLLKTNIASFVKTHVKFLGEFPSFRMLDADLPLVSSASPYIYPSMNVMSEIQTSTCPAEDIVCAAKTGMDLINNAYELQRRKATEVMVWVLTHINRDTSTEIPCSVPIAYGLKVGMATSTDSSTRVLDEFFDRVLGYSLDYHSVS